MKVIFGLVVTVVLLALTLIPTWAFFLVKSYANPQGFWQNLAMFGIGFWLLSGLQIFFLVGGFILILGFWVKLSES